MQVSFALNEHCKFSQICRLALDGRIEILGSNAWAVFVPNAKGGDAELFGCVNGIKVSVCSLNEYCIEFGRRS